MPVELSAVNLDGLDADVVYARLLRLMDTTEGLGAGVEVRSGVIHDFVLRLQSILWQGISDRLDIVGDSLNPMLASADATIESNVLDLAASNLGLSRYVATNSSGVIAIRVRNRRTVLVPRGTTFTTTGGRTYITTAAYASRLDGAEIRGEADRLLVETNDGYEFTVPAISLTTGLAGRAVANETIITTSLLLADQVQIYTKSAFSGGQDTESDQEILSRIRRQVPNKTLSSRASLAAFLSQFNAVPEITAISTIGFGDEELNRARSGGIFFGGAADTYIRTSPLPFIRQVTKTAIATEVVVGGQATWSLAIERDDAPGFYHLSNARTAAGVLLTIADVVRGVDLAAIGDQQIPRITRAVDAAFSRFQTAAVTLQSASTGVTVGDTQDITIDALMIDRIADAQTLVGDRAHRFVGGDTLVKAAVPVFVSVGIQIHARPGVTLSNANAIRVAVANFLNTAGFATTLHTSRIASIVHNFLPSGADVHTVEAVLETILPDGKLNRQRTSTHLSTLNLPQQSVTGRTCVFYCDPSSIVVSAYVEPVPLIA